MSIGPIELNGTIGRTQDFAQIRHNEENKGMVDHANVVNAAKLNEDKKANTVDRRDDTSNYMKRFDAKEKGNNEYSGDGGSSRKKEETASEGKVIVKNSESSFDIRV